MSGLSNNSGLLLKCHKSVGVFGCNQTPLNISRKKNIGDFGESQRDKAGEEAGLGKMEEAGDVWDPKRKKELSKMTLLE